MSSASPEFFIGLISGTSVDGIDAAVLTFDRRKPTVVEAISYPIPAELTDQIHQLCSDDSLTLESLYGSKEQQKPLLVEVHKKLGELFAEATLAILKKTKIKASQVVAIGSHGQTVRHQPPTNTSNGFSLQIGCPEIIASITGIQVVSDFRSADMAAGGQGAPLAPAFHAAIAPNNKTVAFLNLGGIANITLIRNGKIICGYDTGPANTLMDAWIRQHKNLPYDNNGEWAATGKTDEELLTELLSDPYFNLPAPKSTGREHFRLDRVNAFKDLTLASPENIQATLLALTARSIADEIKKLPYSPSTLYCCGGGSHNTLLIDKLSKLLSSIKILTTQALNINVNYVEAALFAWLAKKNIDGEAIDLEPVTGASKENLLGVRSSKTATQFNN